MEKKVMIRLCAKIVADTDLYETDKEVQNLIDWVCLSEQIRENNNTTNKMVRRKVPKGTNFDDKTEEEIGELDKRIPTQDTWLSFCWGAFHRRAGKAGLISDKATLRGWQQWQP